MPARIAPLQDAAALDHTIDRTLCMTLRLKTAVRLDNALHASGYRTRRLAGTRLLSTSAPLADLLKLARRINVRLDFSYALGELPCEPNPNTAEELQNTASIAAPSGS